jgi:putative oxidoreductase
MQQIFLVGRILLGGFLLYSGLQHFTNLATLSQHTAAKGVPMATAAVVVAGILLLVAGLSFLLGLAPKIGIAALVLFLVPVTLTMHQFWTEHGMAAANDLERFARNVGLLGAVMALAAVPEPWPYSVESRGRVFRWRHAHV